MRGLFLILASALLTLAAIGSSYGEIYELHCRGVERSNVGAPVTYTMRYTLDTRRGYYEEYDRFSNGDRHGNHGYGLNISHDSIRFGTVRISRYSGREYVEKFYHNQHLVFDDRCWGPLIYHSDNHYHYHHHDGDY
jgi:hypothetical protein